MHKISLSAWAYFLLACCFSSIVLIPLPAFSATCPVISTYLTVGSRGQEVIALKQYLIERGYMTTSSYTTYFGPLTASAVATFQARVGLEQTGATGPRTRAALASCADQVQTSAPSGSNGFSIGARGEHVYELQMQLIEAGYLAEEYHTGYYGAITRAAHEAFLRGVGPTIGSGYNPPAYIPPQTAYIPPTQTPPQYIPPTPPVVQNASCSYNGVNTPHGGTLTVYSRALASSGTRCVAYQSTRTCSNGTWNGAAVNDYPFTACAEPQAARSCTVGTFTLLDGAENVFYSQRTVPFESSCSRYAQRRQCRDGLVSGGSEFQYATCDVTVPKSCTVGSVQVPHGSSQTFYQKSLVEFGGSCSTISETRACSDGVLTGTYTNASCTAAATKNCQLEDKSVAHGSSILSYNAKTVPFNTACPAGVRRTCSNGILGGDTQYQYASCAVAAPLSCTVQGSTVAHGSRTTLFSSATVPFGSTCTSQARTCTNGVLSGAPEFVHLQCTKNAALSCVGPGNATIAHGATATVFTSAQVASYEQCTDVSAVKTCSDGSFGSGMSTTCARSTTTPTLSVNKTAYKLDESVVVSFAGASDVRQYEIVQIVPVGTATPAPTSAVKGWLYSGSGTQTLPSAGKRSGTVTFSSTTPAGFTLPFGTYEARLLSKLSSTGTYAQVAKSDPFTVSLADSCSLDDQTVVHGASYTFHTHATVPTYDTCAARGLSRTCTNGQLSGDALYNKKTCAVAAPTLTSQKTSYKYDEQISLAFSKVSGATSFREKISIYKKNGTTVETTPKTWMYLNGTQTVPTTAVPQTGTVLIATPVTKLQVPAAGGTYVAQLTQGTSTTVHAEVEFTIEAALPCTLDSQTVNHGASHVFHSIATVSPGVSCASVSQSRTCTNAVLSGDAVFRFAQCAPAQ